MATILSLSDAIARHVHDGSKLAMEGFTHLIPNAAGHEIIRQRRRNLHLIRMTPDLIYDQLIGAGCVNKLTFGWGGNPGVGSLHRFRDAVENNWPQHLELDEHSHAGMASGYAAGAAGLPFGVLRGYFGTDLAEQTSTVKTIKCPFTNEELTAVPSLNPDVTIIHAQRADLQGNVQLWGILGAQREAILAAKSSIVTVEELVEKLTPVSGSVVIPSWVLSTVCVVRDGSHPSYATGYSNRDNSFYKSWDDISKNRNTFEEWIEKHIFATEDFESYCQLIGLRTLETVNE